MINTFRTEKKLPTCDGNALRIIRVLVRAHERVGVGEGRRARESTATYMYRFVDNLVNGEQISSWIYSHPLALRPVSGPLRAHANEKDNSGEDDSFDHGLEGRVRLRDN